MIRTRFSGKEADAQNSWNDKHIYKIREDRIPKEIDQLEPDKLHTEIEPWLTALFQSEHLSLMVGGGISSAIHHLAKGKAGRWNVVD